MYMYHHVHGTRSYMYVHVYINGMVFFNECLPHMVANEATGIATEC